MNQIHSQSYQICDITQESGMNSDTSQEILKIQKEWAMKFNEQINQNELQFHQQMKMQPPKNNPRSLLDMKTDIQYKGAAGDAGNDLLD
jgi:hypothetical protein